MLQDMCYKNLEEFLFVQKKNKLKIFVFYTMF